MPIEFWKAKTGWFWTARADNGKVIADSAEVYSSRSKAVSGAIVTAVELEAWLEEERLKSRKSQTSAPQKRVVKRSRPSKNSQTRKTGQPKGSASKTT
jgi:hypothetical protein